MSIRITDPKEIDRLVKAGRISASNLEIIKQARKTKAKTAGTVSGLPICPLPPVKPVEILYQRICAEYGRFEEGGEAVWEMEVPFTERGWRIDIALPAFCCAIESDGYRYHGRDLNGFKRDREKQMDLLKCGWIPIRASGEQVRKNLDGLMADIASALQYCRYNRDLELERVSFDRCRLSRNPAIKR